MILKRPINLKNPNARIVDEAFPRGQTSLPPNVVLNLAAGFFGGIALGVDLSLQFP